MQIKTWGALAAIVTATLTNSNAQASTPEARAALAKQAVAKAQQQIQKNAGAMEAQRKQQMANITPFNRAVANIKAAALANNTAGITAQVAPLLNSVQDGKEMLDDLNENPKQKALFVSRLQNMVLMNQGRSDEELQSAIGGVIQNFKSIYTKTFNNMDGLKASMGASQNPALDQRR